MARSTQRRPWLTALLSREGSPFPAVPFALAPACEGIRSGSATRVSLRSATNEVVFCFSEHFSCIWRIPLSPIDVGPHEGNAGKTTLYTPVLETFFSATSRSYTAILVTIYVLTIDFLQVRGPTPASARQFPLRTSSTPEIADNT